MKAVIALFILSFITVGAQNQVKSTASDEKIQLTMKAIISKIDAHLKKNAPVVYKSLNPLLSLEQALEIRDELNGMYSRTAAAITFATMPPVFLPALRARYWTTITAKPTVR